MLRRVLVVEDDVPLREAICDTLALSGYGAIAAADGVEALEALKVNVIDLVISDVHMERLDGYGLLNRVKALEPDLPLLLITAYGTIPGAVQALREGAADYLEKPFEAGVLISKVSQLLPERVSVNGTIAVDRKTQEVLALAKKVAGTEATVLITGESGTGKEVLFRYIHAHSPRQAGPAMAINCAAIPENMLEAILFGYEKGAFTGAYKPSPGKFEQAQGGTLLLDEVSEMSLALQAKLLRVLQEKEVERLGGRQVIPLDVRVVATSNRDIRAEVAAGGFREDLFYRLNVFPIYMPPLRERWEDIVPLAEFLLARAARANGMRVPHLTEDARTKLLEYHWPGNVRELDNVVQRSLIVKTGESISVRDLRFEPVHAKPRREEGRGFAVMNAPEGVDPGGIDKDLKDHERHLILGALSDGGGSRAYAARKLGISPRTLRYKIARMREAGYEIPGG